MQLTKNFKNHSRTPKIENIMSSKIIIWNEHDLKSTVKPNSAYITHRKIEEKGFKNTISRWKLFRTRFLHELISTSISKNVYLLILFFMKEIKDHTCYNEDLKIRTMQRTQCVIEIQCGIPNINRKIYILMVDYLERSSTKIFCRMAQILSVVKHNFHRGVHKFYRSVRKKFNITLY